MWKEEVVEFIKNYTDTNQADFENERKKIKTSLGDIYEMLKDTGCVLAGGALTSIFTNKPVNDWDIYLTKENALGRIVATIYGESADEYFSQYELMVNFVTEKSMLTKIKSTEELVQFIHYKTHDSIESIFQSFDYTINMVAYDFATETFVFHEDFFKHLSQRVLKFNDKTDYPFISLLRANKYRERGYAISMSEVLRIALTCADKEIDSWDALIDQIGSMYGVEKKDIFDTTKEFSIKEAVDQLSIVGLKIGKVTAKSYYMDSVIDLVKPALDTNFLNWYEVHGNKSWTVDRPYNWEKTYEIPVAPAAPTLPPGLIPTIKTPRQL